MTSAPVDSPPALTADNAPELTDAERTMLTWLRLNAWNARRNAVRLGHGDVLRRRFVTFNQLLLTHGRLFRPVEFPAEFDGGEPGTCWTSSWANADAHGLVYVEGMAATAERVWVEHEHGWCARPGEQAALDPTWNPPGLAYLGVPLTPEFRRHAAGQRCAPRLFFSGHSLGRSLLAEGLPDHAVATGTGQPLPEIARLTG